MNSDDLLAEAKARAKRRATDVAHELFMTAINSGLDRHHRAVALVTLERWANEQAWEVKRLQRRLSECEAETDTSSKTPAGVH